MTYHVVFDISEHEFDALVGGIAMPFFFALLALLLVPRTRSLILASWGVWLAIGAAFFSLEEWRTTGGVYGVIPPVFVLIFALPLAATAWFGGSIPVRGRDRPVSARAISTGMGYLLIGLVLVIGNGYASVPRLVRELNNGEATVVAGPVEDQESKKWSYECFTVSGHRFCYDNGGSTGPGFHQASGNNGPIRNGLQVRVSFIKDQIVRLEVADGQVA